MRKSKGNYLKTGRPDTTPSRPSHIRGIRAGNQRGSMKKEQGLREAGEAAFATGRRLTGINADAREPIDQRMPKLTPA